MGKLTIVVLSLILTVFVVHAQDVQTGPSNDNQPQTQVFLKSRISDETGDPVELRILGSRRSAAGATIEAVILDADGRYIPLTSLGGAFTASYGCRKEPLSINVKPLATEVLWQPTMAGGAVQIVLDNSLTSNNLASRILVDLGNILPSISGNDSIAVAVFDHSVSMISGFDVSYAVAERCRAASVSATGIPGVYTAMVSGLRALGSRNEDIKKLVVVTASDDMTTLSFSTQDIVNKAIDLGVSITVVKVGTTAQGYVYRNICGSTGGRMATVLESEIGNVAHIIREVIAASEQHLEVFVPLASDAQLCDDILIHVGYEDDDFADADTAMISIKKRDFRTQRAVVAAFADTNEVGLQDYYPVLSILAEDLLADKSKTVQLVGHVSTDVRGSDVERGLQRVGYVHDFLVAYGVPESQIRIRSDGSRKPLYYLQLDGTQRLLNNRVEAYYLREADLPFVINVALFETEEQATKSVAEWQSRGYKAYFEPVVIKRSPAYQIKLWGYATEEQAINALAVVKRTFKVTNASIE